ncbi:MAG: hypothetical protein DKINENOH_05002 [bacterium]|nr:hypothetical protein [bacterium]
MIARRVSRSVFWSKFVLTGPPDAHHHGDVMKNSRSAAEPQRFVKIW